MKTLITLFVSIITISLSGQISMFVHQHNSATDDYQIDDVRKITFDNGMNVHPHSGTTTNYVIDDVRKITFDNSVVTSNGVTDDISSSFRSYPNPASDQINIEYSLTDVSGVLLEVYNINGTLVKSFNIGEKSSGNHHFLWTCEQRLSTGIYILKLKTDEFIKTNRLVIQNK
jgi:hypothetical protein